MSSAITWPSRGVDRKPTKITINKVIGSQKQMTENKGKRVFTVSVFIYSYNVHVNQIY